MRNWDLESLHKHIHGFDSLSSQQQKTLLEKMNLSFPCAIFKSQIEKRRNALLNMAKSREMLRDASQCFPHFIKINKIKRTIDALRGFAVVFTAGGEGERLRLSLLKQGISPSILKDFTKATYPVPGFPDNSGTLQINLTMISHLCSESGIDIPVIVTTGPENSVTARVIPEILKANNNFGLRNIITVQQDERIHFTNDEKAAFIITDDGSPQPVTQPDETGGPLMKLKQTSESSGVSPLEWLEKLGCRKIIVVQATALYHQSLLPAMASALEGHDCLGVGILRKEFPEKDPFGTFVTLTRNDHDSTIILEQEVRNEETRQIKDNSGEYYLPFNTGFYAFDSELLKKSDLPDYATPPKEILPELPRSPKIGYAATDIFPLAGNPVILTVEPNMYRVLKTVEDLSLLSKAGREFGLDKLWSKVPDNQG
ncbi:MAG: hypothetical protein GX089_03485 [Fibrobacter sp.]|nr:hypothetical protein [Fibrobacter sp.]